MDSFETMYCYYLGQSSHLLLFSFFKFFFFFFWGGGRIFIQIATAPAIFNGFHLNLGTEIRYWLPDFEIICGF